MTKLKKICAGCTAVMLISSAALAADKDNVPSEVNADAIEYDMNTGVASAEGNVLLKYGTTKATGLHALFNVNTKEAHLIGNVIVVDEDMRLTCGALMSNGQGHMVADENVIATQTVLPNEKYPDGDVRTFRGDHIDFYPDDRKHVVIPGGGIAQSEVEGTFTADSLEGWIDDERYIGTGNAHLVSQTRNLEAGGDVVDYDGKQEGKAVVSGNAWAIQNNNTIRGNRLTVYLADDGSLKAEPRVQMPADFGENFEKKSEPEKISSDETVVINPDEATSNET
ncbi:MAG: organic solvent tolerance protein OstA [Selenomonadaceae bacterium]|nr:organic solvent tolerance protein OstA [Selenomonadaceae bacterium]